APTAGSGIEGNCVSAGRKIERSQRNPREITRLLVNDNLFSAASRVDMVDGRRSTIDSRAILDEHLALPRKGSVKFPTGRGGRSARHESKCATVKTGARRGGPCAGFCIDAGAVIVVEHRIDIGISQ